MNAHDVAKKIMKETKTTQEDVARAGGLAGQSSVGSFFRSNNMRVDNLLLILNTCGYELVARSGDSGRPEFIAAPTRRAGRTPSRGREPIHSGSGRGLRPGRQIKSRSTSRKAM